MKRFGYPPLGKELKMQNDIANKQYQKLDNHCVFDKMIKKEALFTNIIVKVKNLINFYSNQFMLFYTNF